MRKGPVDVQTEAGRIHTVDQAGDDASGAGRGHYARARSTLMMGGGIQAGQVIGRTDQNGASVEDRPVSAPDFMATVCEILGIDWTKIYDGPGGRTVPLVEKGANPNKELLTS